MFWVDEAVEKIIKERPKQRYVVTDWKTPSGKIHVGALRGIIIHDAIVRGLEERGKKVCFIYGFDSFDPVDSLPLELKESHKKYLGVPLAKTPAPQRETVNFAKFYGSEFEAVYRRLGVDSETFWMEEFYREGKFDEAIEIVLKKADKIRKIYKEVSGSIKEKNWCPLQVVCPKCGKIGTTEVRRFDGKKVEFECRKDLVEWAEGCGKRGRISPFGGRAKMPYKVEIAAKWFVLGTDFEAAGKDHFTKGGTFAVAREIAKQIFKIKPAMGFGYEWFLLGGKKMSTSKGIGCSAEEVSKILPPEILRFFMVRTKAKRTIDFDPRGTTMILDIFDEYDRAVEAYYSFEKGVQATESRNSRFLGNNAAKVVLGRSNSRRTDLARALFYGMINPENEPAKYRYRFSKVALGLQMPRLDIEKDAVIEKGEKLTEDELKNLKEREKYAKLWLKRYAPESFKFEVKEELPKEAAKINREQREFLRKVLQIIEEKDLSGEDLHREIHNLKKEMKIDPRLAFSAIYLAFLGKDSGPQAGWFLVSLNKNFVLKRLREVIS